MTKSTNFFDYWIGSGSLNQQSQIMTHSNRIKGGSDLETCMFFFLQCKERIVKIWIFSPICLIA